MNRQTICILAAALAAAGCGGTSAGIQSLSERTSTMSALAAGATEQRAYLGVDDDMTLGVAPVLATMDLVGGAQIELEVVTPDASPIRFEVWRVRHDGSATLEIPVDAASGFALEQIDADEDGTWAVRFPGEQQGEVIVHMDCIGGMHGCAQTRQPGETCPAGWTCDVGLDCELPVGVCGPLAGVGTCVPTPTSCAEDSESVCGCDGRTYASVCDARVAQVPILQTGACGG
jgi:hypothetical protein